jgi:hypothetical protein
MTERDVAWELSGPGATLKCGPLEAYARCDAQGLDVVVTKWGERLTPGISVLCSVGPMESAGQLEVAERFVRGNDFVVSCLPAGQHRITPHVYWRAAFRREVNAARVELVLSAQTDLLDSGPTWHINSFVREAALSHCSIQGPRQVEDVSAAVRTFDAATSSEHLFLFRVPSLGISYAQMVHPSDFAGANVALNGTQPMVVTSTLFPERLEKGVIRRGRICGWIMPIQNDLETAVQLAREFVEEPLPLTA